MPLLSSLFRFPLRLRRKARRSRAMLMITLLAITILVFAPFYIIYKPPKLLINYFAYRWPGVLWQVDVSQKVVALTIDDAPTTYTPELLQVLKENNAHATFFIIGSQVDGRQDVLTDLVRHGHELGNHAMHDEPSRSLKQSDLIGQLHEVKKIIQQAYNDAKVEKSSHWFRPGSGFFNEKVLAAAEATGYNVVLGSIYPHDPQIPYWRVNAAHILSMLRPGAIIICHDRRSWTVPMLKKILPEMKRRGYSVVTVSELLNASNAS